MLTLLFALSKRCWSQISGRISKADTKQANGLVNTAIEDGTIADLGVIVLDELHMIDDDHRGYLMELMASKLLSLEVPVQIVGMSATLTVCCSYLYIDFDF